MKKLYFLMMMAATLFVLGCGGGDDSDDDVWGGSGNDLKDKWFVCVPPSDKISEIAQWVNQDIDYGYTESSEYFDSTGKLDHPGGRVFWFESTYGNGQVVALHIIDDHTMEGYINGGTFQLGNTSSFELKKYLLYAMDMGSFLGKLGFYSSHLAYYNYDKINNQIFVYMLPGTFTISGNDLLMDGGGRWVGVNPKKVYTSTTATIKNVSAEVLSIGNSTVNFGYEGGEKNITVNANYGWSIDYNSAKSWLTATKTNDNTLTLTAQRTSLRTQRIATITLKGNRKTVDIEVTQEGATETAPVNTTVTVKGVSFKMIGVEGGTFTMGTDNVSTWDTWDSPAHSVTLSTFSIGETEVTQELWVAVMGNGYTWRSYWRDGQGDNYPANYVSWYDCQEFINKLNQLTGKTFRLPTEAEWEYAARGGKNKSNFKYSGSDNANDVAWYSANSNDRIHTVKSKGWPNIIGLFDMTGNVREWCGDWNSQYTADAQINPKGPSTGTHRIIRGGDYLNSPTPVWNRSAVLPTDDSGNNGLRLAMD